MTCWRSTSKGDLPGGGSTVWPAVGWPAAARARPSATPKEVRKTAATSGCFVARSTTVLLVCGTLVLALAPAVSNTSHICGSTISVASINGVRPKASGHSACALAWRSALMNSKRPAPVPEASRATSQRGVSPRLLRRFTSASATSNSRMTAVTSLQSKFVLGASTQRCSQVLPSRSKLPTSSSRGQSSDCQSSRTSLTAAWQWPCTALHISSTQCVRVGRQLVHNSSFSTGVSSPLSSTPWGNKSPLRETARAGQFTQSSSKAVFRQVPLLTKALAPEVTSSFTR
mmetsp:Transcript_27005/g.85823  ORF Transcript_27005/g.85823 Transcript_27005/m.85823 type:complete len:286 (-) Transcript_27005:247-1104(-)